MRPLAILLCTGLVAGLVWLMVQFSPLFLNSRIERLGEKDLPKILVEKGGVIYCRMKADDFRFPLPPGSRATNLVITGGFDTVDGSVEVRFESTNQISAFVYQSWVSGRMQVGGQVTAETTQGGLLIKFHYFGDK